MIPAPLTIAWNRQDDAAVLRDKEWLTTNGFGGFASGSVLGVPTRRYHGIFVPNLADPKGRYVTLPRIDEIVQLESGTVNLGGAEHCDGSLQTDAHRYLREFKLEALIPTWTFELEGRVLEKTIVMPHGQNTVCVRYRLLSGAPLPLHLRVYAAARRQDSVLEQDEEWPFAMRITGTRHELEMQHGQVIVRLKVRPHPCSFVAEPHVDHEVMYRVERDRGYDHSEHLFSPGYYAFTLSEGQEASFMATTETWEALAVEPDAIIAGEHSRMRQLIELADVGNDDFARHLVMAADQFIVVPGSRRDEALLAIASGEEMRSVMAGYHWFNDWGRDTMISLEGLTVTTRRYREARAILRTFAHYIKDGLLPNLFPEGEREALYHTVDATLWYFHAADRYMSQSGDVEFIEQFYPQLQSVIEHHIRGTHYGIGMDAADGLIHAGKEGYQLTWMDAKVDGWVVTPRRGKPVEIQALWYNALSLMAEWGDAIGKADHDYRARAEKVKQSFNARYWSAERQHLLDVIDGPDGDDAALRPNQVFSMSLRHPVLDSQYWEPVLGTVQQQLLTPFGLRTLSPEHPDYQPYYQGTLRARDAAYHQGTVWPWLLGHFVDASLRVHKDTQHARSMLQAFKTHMYDAGVGSISEIFDAEAPHTPRGCIAQAWSIAEVLRAWVASADEARSDSRA